MSAGRTVEVRAGMSLVYARLEPCAGGWMAYWTEADKPRAVGPFDTQREAVEEVRAILRAAEMAPL